MKRRAFIAGLGAAAGSSVIWPLAARAQQRTRRIGVLVTALTADDPQWQHRGNAFVQGLQQLGWTDGRNIRIDYRFGLGDPARLRKSAAELIALMPDLILSAGPAIETIADAAPSMPIVFANVQDPVGNAFVASLARPGGNVTGFMSAEFGLSAKSLELLKAIAPKVTRVAILRTPTVGTGPVGALQAAAPSYGVELTPFLIRQTSDIERDIAGFARGENDGMIVLGAGIAQDQRTAMITSAARHRLPAVYQFRGIVDEGGLISSGIDQAEPYRLAAGYVDRILKGEKPADLPVQAPNKLELVINLKTAKALGLTVPPTLLAIADEVIE
jgi:putative tryptophan/tyrosine transport system substrate-binding protein